MSTRVQWLLVLGINKSGLHKDSCICSRHYPAGDITKWPQSNLGKSFASPIKIKLPRAKRAKRQVIVKGISAAMLVAEGNVNGTTTDAPIDDSEVQPLTTVVGEQLCSDYGFHELPNDADDISSETHPVSRCSI